MVRLEMKLGTPAGGSKLTLIPCGASQLRVTLWSYPVSVNTWEPVYELVRLELKAIRSPFSREWREALKQTSVTLREALEL
jgi:hypothetical protein